MQRLTVLTSVGLKYERQRDAFRFSPLRNTDSFRVMPGVEFNPRALVSGSAWVGYRSFTPNDAMLPAQAGLVSELGLSYTLLGATTFGVSYDRDYQFSYDARHPYFVDDSVGLYVRRALGARLDVVGSAARHRYTYQPLGGQALLAAEADPVSVTENLGVSLGYRLKRQSRIGFGVSYWSRASALLASQNYDGLRIGTTVNYGF
jgi:hypothetical protein